jgi:hypothetical protein
MNSRLLIVDSPVVLGENINMLKIFLFALGMGESFKIVKGCVRLSKWPCRVSKSMNIL